MLKYFKYSDTDYCNELKELLSDADDSVFAVEKLYAALEAHIEIFSDNSVRTVFEFFNEIGMSLIGWGTNIQRAHLLRKLLSEEIKTKVNDVLERYSKIKAHLITDYGGADRIVSAKKRPSPGNKKERYK